MIFPVRIKEYYETGPFADEAGTLRDMLPWLKCAVCKGPISWRSGYVMHSITFGGPDESYCSKKCLEAR